MQKQRGIKGYKSIPIDKLLSILDASEAIKRLKLSETQEKKIIMQKEHLKTHNFLLNQKNKKLLGT